MSRLLVATWLGRQRYVEAWRLQEAIASRCRAGGPDRLLLLEHDPVYTVGKRGSTANLLASVEELRGVGASVYAVDRGGDITYHGPGQLVGYPIVHLGETPDLVAFVRSIEEAIVTALAGYGVQARTIEKKTGVWVGDAAGAKIAAIGVRVSRKVSTHGFALNVSTELRAFDRMIPCGFAHEVASLRSRGVEAPLREVGVRCATTVAAALGRELVWDDGVQPAADEEIPETAAVRSARDLVREELATVGTY